VKRAITSTIPPALATPGGAEGERPSTLEAPGREHEALWFALARRRLTSVVLVPADGTVGVERVGKVALALAEVGRKLGDLPVTAIVMEPADYGFISRTAAVLASTHEEGNTWPGASPLSVIVAIQSVVTEPLGLALVQAADGVVVCVEMGQTQVSAARETIELVGAGRIVGCVVV
jgi:hypothetical protein